MPILSVENCADHKGTSCDLKLISSQDWAGTWSRNTTELELGSLEIKITDLVFSAEATQTLKMLLFLLHIFYIHVNNIYINKICVYMCFTRTCFCRPLCPCTTRWQLTFTEFNCVSILIGTLNFNLWIDYN